MEIATQAGDCRTSDQERRNHRRTQVESPATLLLVGRGMTVNARLTELSDEGCRLQVGQHLVSGASTRIEVLFRVCGMDFRFGGVAQWSDGWSRMGVRFTPVPKRRRADLSLVIDEMIDEEEGRCAREAEAERACQARRAAESFPNQPDQATIPPSLALPATPEPDPGGDFQSLRTTIHLVPEPASIDRQARNEGSPDHPEAGKLERRALPRQTLGSFATLHTVRSKVSLNGQFLDLSIGGCRIQLDTPLRLASFTRVELEFWLEGMPFRLAGLSQHSCARRVIGIRFAPLSERKQAQLGQALEELMDRTAKRPSLLPSGHLDF